MPPATSDKPEILDRAIFVFQTLESIAGLASAAIPGIQTAASLAVNIISVAKKVKTNAEDCELVANQCGEVVLVLADATSGKSLEDADPQLPADLARLDRCLKQIQDEMNKQAKRSTFLRVIDSIGDSDHIAKCNKLLNQCYQIFQLQSAIALRRYYMTERRKPLLPQPQDAATEIDASADIRNVTPTRSVKLIRGKGAHPSLRNNSSHPIMYNSLRYPTALHLYWAFKIPNAAEKIRTAGESVDEAAKIVHNHRDAIRADWAVIQVVVNEQVLLCKFMQYPGLLQELHGTGDAEIINDSSDSFWGLGKDGRGKNELGKALMRLRNDPPWPFSSVGHNSAQGEGHSRRRILLVNAHPSFRNNSPHPIMYNGLRYPTASHLFWALKMPALAEQIRTCSEKSEHAREIERNNRNAVRSDWDHIQALANEQVMLCKFTQYPGLIRELLETGDAEIVNDAPSKFWGLGKDGKGRNELGKALERLRAALKSRIETLPTISMVAMQT